MLIKKVKDGARAVAENIGIVALSVSDASEAAEQRRAALVDAQAAIQKAEAALEAAYDRGASAKEISEAEARVADVRLNAERAQRAYTSAEKRQAAAREAEGAERKTAAMAKRDAALEIRAQAATEIDRLAAEIAEQVRVYDAQANALSEAAAAGVASRTFHIGGAEISRHALERAGAFPSHWLGDKAQQPGAAQIAAQHAGAVLAGA